MTARRLLAALVAAALLLGAALGLALWSMAPSEPVRTYVVQRGDTLFLIAQAEGVTVDELRAWNGIEGDLIEVGQVLVLQKGEAPAEVRPAAAKPRPRRAAPRPPRPAGPELVMPDPKPCLEGPSADGLGERDAVASAGLSHAQVSAAMSGFVHHTLSCLDGASPTGALRLEVRVACTGLVDEVRVLDAADWPDEVAACVTETLGFAPFPAHDLPNGEVFEYPLRYTPG